MSSQAFADAGRLRLRPGGAVALICERPVVAAPVMQRLTQGRHAAIVPDLLAALFALCGHAHRLTARNAIRAALGLPDEAPDRCRRAAWLRLMTLRDHLHRLALDLPARVPVEGLTADASWLRSAPMADLATPGAATADPPACLTGAWLRWLEQRLFGAPPAQWLRGGAADPAMHAAEWAAACRHPVARWFDAVQPRAQSMRLACRPLLPSAADETDLIDPMHALARAIADDAGFASRPHWQGAPAETGPWTRTVERCPVRTVWDRLAARLQDLARLAVEDHALRHGSLWLGPGQAIAWTEMARGLLVHWVQLDGLAAGPSAARVEAYRVLAPTEWNFHPEGALAEALRGAPWRAQDAVLAAAALDPCVEIHVDSPETANA